MKYPISGIFIFVGLLLLINAFKEKSSNSKMLDIINPATKNYGKGYSLSLGIFLIIIGIYLLA